MSRQPGVLEDAGADLGVALHLAPLGFAPAAPGLKRMASAIPSLPRSWTTPAAWTRCTRPGARPSASAGPARVIADGQRVAGGALVTQVERLGQQHHRGQQQLRGLLAGCARGSASRWTWASARPAWSQTAIRQASSSSPGRRPPSGWSTETMPRISPCPSRSGSSSMSSGCQASGSEAGGGAAASRRCSHHPSRASPSAARSAPSRSCSEPSSSSHSCHGLTRPEQHAARLLVAEHGHARQLPRVAVQQPHGDHLEGQLGPDRLGQRIQHRARCPDRTRRHATPRACCAGAAASSPRPTVAVRPDRRDRRVAVPARRPGCGRRAWPRRARRRRERGAWPPRPRRRPGRSRRSARRRCHPGGGSRRARTASRTRSAAVIASLMPVSRMISSSSSPPKR